MENKKYKEGFVREDGMVYWRYRKDRGHVWLTQEKYKEYVDARKKYRLFCAQEFYKMREKIDPMDRSYFGKYSFAKNKYYIGISTSGKEVWVHKEKYLKYREKQNANRNKFAAKLRMLEKPSLKIGDPHPENNELFVCYFIGNKPYFGSKEKLETIRENRKISCRKRDIKYLRLRRETLLKMANKRRRGDLHPDQDKIFWEYNNRGAEKWLSCEEFKRRHELELQRRKLNRLKSKDKQNVQ